MKTWRVIDLIEWTAKYFERHEIPTPRLDAELLLGYILQKSRLQLYLHFEMPVFHEGLSQFRTLIKKRAARMPVSYLTNHKEFLSLDFYVNQHVLIPRPETEVLVETVLQQQQGQCRFVDIGTGSGAIAISLAYHRPDWEAVATDVGTEILEVAQKNAAAHNCADRLTFLQGDLFDPLGELSNPRFDWIASNPPYVSTEEAATLSPDVRKHEPEIALFAGSDGLSIIRRIVADAPKFLNLHGKLILEIGYNQSPAVQDLIKSHPSYTDYQVIKDYSGIERIIVAGV
ncbi:MAG: peptide chain release factor N(5)-glutamine methyltransferase [Candidatus Poribacteria bacterium]|nr:peptide chain release factor N(5)-glutamine methyltransferase [Candidatus Poribacteria bacterium]